VITEKLVLQWSYNTEFFIVQGICLSRLAFQTTAFTDVQKPFSTIFLVIIFVFPVWQNHKAVNHNDF
jgi:hypothetical protein